MNEIDYTVSDGYDVAQTASCFLWQFAGRKVSEIYGKDRRGKEITIKLACYREVDRFIDTLRNRTDRHGIIEYIDFTDYKALPMDPVNCFEQEQTVLRVAVLGLLLDCHAVVLACALAFQFEGCNGKAVEKHNKVDALVIVNPNFLHDGENVGIVLGDKVDVVVSGGLTIQQVQMHIGNLNAGFQRFDKTAALVIDALNNELDNGFLGLPIIDFPQCRHCVRLCRVQKTEQQFAVHGRGAVIISFAFALYVAVIIN